MNGTSIDIDAMYSLDAPNVIVLSGAGHHRMLGGRIRRIIGYTSITQIFGSMTFSCAVSARSGEKVDAMG